MQIQGKVNRLFRETPAGVPVAPLDLDRLVKKARANQNRRRRSRLLVTTVLAAGVLAPLIQLSALFGDRRTPDRATHADSTEVQRPASLEFTLTSVPKGLILLADTTEVSPADALEEIPGSSDGLVLHSKKYGVPAAADDILGNIPRGSPSLDVWVFRAPFDPSDELANNEGARLIEVRGLPAILMSPRGSDQALLVHWSEHGVVVKVLGTNLSLEEVLAVVEGIRLAT